ncbi:MAG: hypothetical protein U0R52_06815 [Solirubrobacterales bacterium]
MRKSSKHGLLAALACAVALTVPVAALAHGSSVAVARQPSFDSSSLRLVGAGGFAAERKHPAVRVTVCLSKRFAGRFVKVRCNTNTKSGRMVKAKVAVPGCVRGAWRTEVLGQALGRDGWSHDATDASRIFRC